MPATSSTITPPASLRSERARLQLGIVSGFISESLSNFIGIRTDDVVQEVFMYLHKKSSIFDPSKGTARSWIFQIAYTQAFLRKRKLKASGFYASGIQDKQVECYQLGSGEGAEYDHTVEGLFGRNGWKKIEEDLTGDQRETLRLHFFEGYTFTEIADKLGQSYGNVRNHHYRGLEKVRKHLTDRELNRR